MKLVLLHNHYDQNHLNSVIEEMKVLGAPTIRCYDLGFDGLVQAIEGCHRLRACEVLGITPELDFVDGDTLLSDIDLDVDSDAETIDELGDWENYSIEL